MATMLGDRMGRTSMSPQTMRTLMDSIANRLDEARDISRYMTGLLVFLGLLGTFWGLIETVTSVKTVIQGLKVGGDASQVFDALKEGLAAPLNGMGISFSSSLFGLAGSLVLGFHSTCKTSQGARTASTPTSRTGSPPRCATSARPRPRPAPGAAPALIGGELRAAIERLREIDRGDGRQWQAGDRGDRQPRQSRSSRASSIHMRTEQQMVPRLGRSRRPSSNRDIRELLEYFMRASQRT